MDTSDVTTKTGLFVALRKESVDRNCYLDNIEITQAKSLSARRAWIEISKLVVALLAVGRSLSARRAWIEICVRLGSLVWALGRSPQGERG